MKNKHDSKHIAMLAKADESRLAETYVWATSEESKRQAVSSYLIQSIAQRHGGNASIDVLNYSIDIDVPEAEKLACAREIQEKLGLTLH